LVTNISLVNVVTLGQSNLEHGDNSAVLQSVKTFVKRLELINDGDVADLVDLMETFDSVLHEFSKIHG